MGTLPHNTGATGRHDDKHQHKMLRNKPKGLKVAKEDQRSIGLIDNELDG